MRAVYWRRSNRLGHSPRCTKGKRRKVLNGTKADPMGGAKRSKGYQGVKGRDRMLREREGFMLLLGDPTPPPPPPTPVVEQQVTNSEWMEEYHHWWGDPEEIEWEKIEKGREMAERLYPEYDEYWDEYEWDEIGRYELAWPEYAHPCRYDFDSYESDEEERTEWTHWWFTQKETAA